VQKPGRDQARHCEFNAFNVIARNTLSAAFPSRCGLAYQLAANYNKEFIDWAALSFETTTSAEPGIPGPDFAIDVK
jgi:hypothetical protein